MACWEASESENEDSGSEEEESEGKGKEGESERTKRKRRESEGRRVPVSGSMVARVDSSLRPVRCCSPLTASLT